jgi:hypothetical protein
MMITEGERDEKSGQSEQVKEDMGGTVIMEQIEEVRRREGCGA